MTTRAALLYPEWQGCQNKTVHTGAIWLAEELFSNGDFIQINVPTGEIREGDAGVLALHSIIPCFTETMRILRHRIVATGFDRIYLHIDVNVLNPNSFSDVLMPTAGGPFLSELALCMKQLTSCFQGMISRVRQ